MFMSDLPPHNPNEQIAPSTQSRLRVLDEVIEISANLMRMIQQQTQQRVEAASQRAGGDITNSPWPLITEDPAGAIEKLAKSIRHTVALAEQLEHPPKSPSTPGPERGIKGEKFDISRMSDADLAKHLEMFERKEASERERTEYYPHERAENHDAKAPSLNRSIADRVADICRALNLPQFPKGHPWRENFLLDLTALDAFVNEYRSTIPPPVPKREAAPNQAPPSTVPPDD